MSEQPPPFGTWILQQTDLPQTLANAITRGADDPDWPRFGDYWAVNSFINPHQYGAGVGGIEDAYARYKAEFPDA